MQDCPGPTYHRTCWDSGGRDCCSNVLPRRSKSSRPLVNVGLGEDVPASGLTGAAITTGVMLSSLLSDDCRKSAQKRPPHQQGSLSTPSITSLPTPFVPSTTRPISFSGSQHVTWKLFQPLLSPAWAGCGAGSFRPARNKSKNGPYLPCG